MDWSLVNEVAAHLSRGLPSFAAAILLLIAARFFFLISTPFRVDEDLLDAENPAIGVVFGSFLLGVAIVLVGTLFSRDQDGGLVAMAKILVEGVTAVGLMRISIWINDRFILHRFCIVKELRSDKNLGVAFCVAGSCVACALILNGAVTGFSKNFVYGLRDIGIFWLVGQFIVVLGASVYQRVARYDVHQLIEYDDNVAVGIGFGAFLIALGFVVRSSIVGAGLDPMVKELPRTLLIALTGIPILFAVNVMAARLVTAKISYEDEVEMHGNIAVSVVVASVTLAAAMLLAFIIQR